MSLKFQPLEADIKGTRLYCYRRYFHLLSKRSLSLLFAITMIIQIWTVAGVAVAAPSGPEVHAAAASGPVLLTRFPADNDTSVPINSILMLRFDEAVYKPTGGTAAVRIYDQSTNALVETIVVSTSTGSVVGINGNSVSIDVNDGRLVAGKSYYVLMDSGAFLSVSGTSSTGISTATEWNFSVIGEDAAIPSVSSRLPAHNGTANITDPIVITFSEPVNAVQGNINIASDDGLDSQVISVLTPAAVTGNGTNMITILPPTPLIRDKNYIVTIDANAFVDRAGNWFAGFSGTQWTFHTNMNILPPTLTPGNGVTGVNFTNPTLSLTFDIPMQAGIGSLRVYTALTNTLKEAVAITASHVSGGAVTIPLTAPLTPNTVYYVQVDSGAVKSATNENYQGINDTVTWSFTTKSEVDTVKPYILTSTPTDNGTLENVNGSLIMKFNESVYPGNGSITIKGSSANLVCTIPVTSTSVSGGGTDTITITPCASLVQGGAYSVQITDGAFLDTSGLKYEGIATNNYTTWNFTVKTDTTIPELLVVDPPTGTTGVRRSNLVLAAAFNEAVKLSPGATATLYTEGSATPVSALTLSKHPTDPKQVLLAVAGALTANTSYYVRIADGAIQDVAGNSFQGILNSYRWTFKTVVSDSVAPLLTTVTIDGSAVVLTYDQELDPSAIPSAAQYYVSVNTLPRTVTSVGVTGKQVKLTLSSGVVIGQAVKVSFSSGALRNLGSPPIVAASFANKEVTNSTDTSIPHPLSGTIAGAILTLSFNKPLASFTGTNAMSQFAVRLNGSVYTPTVTYTSGSNLVLVLPNAYSGTGSVTVSYTPGVGGDHLRDTIGYTVSLFSEFFVSNGNDTVAPVLLNGVVAGNKIMLVYNEGLRTTTVPPRTSFSVLVNGAAATVLSVTFNNTTVELLMNSAIATGQTILVTYVPGTPALADLAGNPAPVLAGYQIISGSTSTATLSSATVGGNILTLNYSSALSSTVVPTNAQYVIKANGTYIGANTVAVSGTQVILTLTKPIQTGQTVTLSYYASGSLLKDLSNQNVPAFTDYPVTTSSSGTGVVVNLPNYLSADGEGGAQFNSTAVSTQSGTTSNGRSINRYVVNSDYLSSAFNWVKNSGSQLKSPVISIEVPSKETAAVVQIPIYALVDASTRVSNGALRVDYGDLRFELPMSAVKYTQEVVALGGSLTSSTLEIAMEKTTDSKLTNAIGSASAVILGLPVDFSVKVISAGKQAEVEQYDQYVTRTFVLPASSASQLSQLTVVRFDEGTGALSYVPTTAESGTGGIHVSFKRKGNSTYAIVRKAPTTYSDMFNHWANDDVSLLASKWIVSGTSFTNYSPSKAITRSDFAKYIANGLGLTGNASGAAKFRDVGTAGKDAAYIGAVSNAGIISGKSTGKFDPNAAITREEMASMMLRAMNYAGVQPSNASLTKFTDSSKISSWATNAVAACVDAGIIAGVTPTTFQPKANATRAQAAIMIVRMLEYSELLQSQ